MNELSYIEALLFLLIPAAAGILASKWAGAALKRRGSSPLAVRTLHVLITVMWVATAIAGLSIILGPLSFLSTITVSAVAGIMATLALQTTIQNVIAGFILLQHRFLRLGDVIQLSGVKGAVVSIGLVEVVIRLEDGALASISNASLLSGPLVNYTASTRLSGEY